MGLFDFLKRLVSPGQQQPGNDYSQLPATLTDSSNSLHDARTAPSELESGLDASHFQPLSAEEALSLTKSDGWQSAYLDSLNEIPPADLPRIRIIDRTMVSMGILSDDDLVEIHKVGLEMAKYRKDAAATRAIGDAAVRQSRQESERLKQQKKAEAQRRRDEHRARVEQNRRTDIVYIGRGISKGLSDRRSNIEMLRQNQLPLLSTPADLAGAIGITIPQLRWLAFHAQAAKQVHYVHFTIPKKSGGERELARPLPLLASVQRWILDNVLNMLPAHDSAHGFVQGRSITTGATPHVGADILISVDLKDFFPSIHFYRIEGLFRSLGYSPAVATLMASLCTESRRTAVSYRQEQYLVASGLPSLPQGACTSPALSNLTSRHLDVRLSGLASKLGWTYTRYADDLSFSAKQSSMHEKEKQIGYVLARLRHICEDEGFALNSAKTRVLRKHQRQVVTGLTTNDRVGVSRKTRRRIRAILHRAQFEGLDAQNRDGHANFRGWLSGMIAFIESVDRSEGQRLRDALRRVS